VQRTYDAWSQAAVNLTTLVSEAQSEAAPLGDRFAPQIQALTAAIDQRAIALLPQVAALDRHTRQVVALAQSLCALLARYGEGYTTLAAHSAVLSEQALPKLTQAAHILDTLDAIFDPLSLLLQQFQHPAASGDLKASAADAVNAFTSAATAQGQGFSGDLQAALDGVLARVLPLDRLQADLAAITADLSGGLRTDFTNTSAQLLAEFDALRQAQQPLSSYQTVDAQGHPLTVATALVDQALVDQATALFQAIQAATAGPPGGGTAHATA
jgi:hypothetical protein